MNFSGEDRKEVFFFFEEVLKSYKDPVYYENLRGHVSKAPINVRKYVIAKCRGDHFLEYFKRRKNYFNVEDGKISLKDEFDKEQQESSQSNRSKKKNSKGKFVRRNTSFSYSSYAGALKGSDSNKNGEKDYETIAVTYFRNRLIRKKKERLWAIEVNDLPKKVKRHLQLYYRQKVKNFLSDHSDKFVIDSDDETVSLAYVAESATTAESSSVDQESSSNSNQNSANIAVDSEIRKASEYLECVVFFIDILKKVSQTLPVEKLGGYFSQARKEIKEHVKMNYTSFKYFFDDAPLIFSKNDADEISLSKDYRRLIKTAENLIKGAINGTNLPPEMTLKQHIVHIFKPQISPRCSSILEQEGANNEALSFEDMAHAEDIIEEMLKSHSTNRRESEMSHVSTDEFFDNYLMRSTSRESSISHSSRSRSISVEHLPMKNSSSLKGVEKFGSDTGLGFDDKEVIENTFLKCILTVELFCLEFMESEFNFIQNYENKAIDYFMEILDASSTKLWRLTSLQGTIGNNREIAHFMNKLYKGEKFVSFFEKHPQFEVDPPFVKVALFDKTNDTEGATPSLSNAKNAVKDLKDLYEISEFKILLKETYAYLYEVCEFCKDKDDVKIDRVGGMLPRFPTCFNMIKSSKGQSLSEKIEHFLHKIMIFQFPKKGSLSFSYECYYKKCQILFAWFEKMNSYDPSLEFVSFSDFWTINVFSRYASNNNRKNCNSYIDLEECYQNIVDIIEEVIERRSELSYCELPKIIPENILFSLTNGNYYSRPLISALLESGSFRIKDGKISLQKTSEDDNSDPSDNESTENLELENQISEECSDELSIQNNISNNLVNSPCSSSVNDKDTSNHSTESQTEFSFNQTPKILQTIENCETKETNSPSTESKPNLSLEVEKMIIDTPLINHGQNRNENPTSETIEESYKEENENHMNVLNTKENFSLDILTDSELSNLEIETTVCTKASESVLSSKAKNVVGKENEYVDKISIECYRYEEEVNSKRDSPLPDSDVFEKLSDTSLLTPPPECEFEQYPKESESDSINLLPSEDLSEFANDQIEPSCHLNLNTNYVAPLKEKSLDEDSLTKHNPEFDDTESSIEATKEEVNISFISEDEKSSKLEIDLLGRKNSNDSDDTKTHMTKEQLHNSELPNKETITKIFEKSTGKNENLDKCKTSEQIEDEPFQNDVLEVPDFSDTQPQARYSVAVPGFNEISESKELQATSKNTNISTKHSFAYTPEELFDTSLMKIYLNSEKVSEERTHGHNLESEEKNTAMKVPFRSSYPMLTLSQNGTIDINVSRASSCNDLSSEYLMQPIMAKVALLTNSSCIALADLKKSKKNIYFLKYVFTCEHQDDCSECFSALQIGDEVSCFVPLTEISQKIWIAFMVNKDNSDSLSEISIFDKLNENAKAIYEGSTKSISISPQIKNSVHHLGCQTEFPKCDNHSQTDLNDDVDLHKATKETSCQTRSVSLKNVFVQTENLAMKSITQTSSNNAEIPLSRNCAKCQMYMNGDKDVMSESGAHQNSWLGEITHITKNVSCQTFSTGQIIMSKHHPM